LNFFCGKKEKRWSGDKDGVHFGSGLHLVLAKELYAKDRVTKIPGDGD